MAQDDYIRTALRVPPELHRALHEAADKSSKSFNAEIIDRLQRSFEADAEDRQEEMLLEMRRTQLHLEMNTIKQEIGHLYERSRDLQTRLKGTVDEVVIADAEAELDRINAERKKLDRHGHGVLARLAELESFHKANKTESPAAPTVPKPSRVVIVGNLGREVEPIEKTPPGPYGPQRSRNARKPKP